MTDWKGNIIKEGHILVVVDIADAWEGCTFFVESIDLGTGERYRIGEDVVIEKEYLFNKGRRIKVVDESDFYTMMFSILTDAPYEVPINRLDECMGLYDSGYQILCIEGISDSKDDYYKWYFDNK